jgi:2-oxoglutarate dehydrogenase E2 component (dihydrolipoamide succinyltransferase)
MLTTAQIDVAVNAPEAGTITELLTEEESTVTVGQDIAKLDTSGEAKPKEESSKEESKPEPKEEKEEKPSEPVAKEAPPPPKPEPKQESKQESKPAPPPPKKESKPTPPPPQKSDSGKKGDEEKKFTLWSREERRV